MFKAPLVGLNGIQDLMGSIPKDMVNKKNKTDDRNQSTTIKTKESRKKKGNMISLSRMSTTNLQNAKKKKAK